jgi:hypothetical protein
VFKHIARLEKLKKLLKAIKGWVEVFLASQAFGAFQAF